MSNVTAAYLNRMLNVLLPETKSAIPCHLDTSEVVCIYGSAIERFFDKQGNETEIVVMKAGSNNNLICRHLCKCHNDN